MLYGRRSTESTASRRAHTRDRLHWRAYPQRRDTCGGRRPFTVGSVYVPDTRVDGEFRFDENRVAVLEPSPFAPKFYYTGLEENADFDDFNWVNNLSLLSKASTEHKSSTVFIVSSCIFGFQHVCLRMTIYKWNHDDKTCWSFEYFLKIIEIFKWKWFGVKKKIYIHIIYIYILIVVTRKIDIYKKPVLIFS